MKKNYHHGNLKPALLKETAKMIAEGGVEKVTMRELSKRIGVSRTALYQHFKNKNDLLSAVASSWYTRLQVRLKAIRTDPSMDILSRLYSMPVAYVNFAIENPSYYKLMFGDEVIKNGITAELSAATVSAYNELITLIEMGQKEKKIVDDDPLSIANVIWAMSHGLSTLLVSGQIQISYRIIRIPLMNIHGRVDKLDDLQRFIQYSIQSLFNGIVLEKEYYQLID